METINKQMIQSNSREQKMMQNQRQFLELLKAVSVAQGSRAAAIAQEAELKKKLSVEIGQNVKLKPPSSRKPLPSPFLASLVLSISVKS